MGVSEGWGCRGAVPGASQWGGGSVGHRGAPSPMDEGDGVLAPPHRLGGCRIWGAEHPECGHGGATRGLCMGWF